jgi:predicted dehydrogenase
MTTTKTLRTGVIGLGAVAQMMHLYHLNDMDEFTIGAIADVSADTVQVVGDHYHIPADARYTDYRAMVQRPDLDAILIASGGTHTDFVIDSLNAGKHVFSEKPLCYTYRELDAIQDAVARSGKVFMVGYMKRFDPGFRYAREQVLAMKDLRFARVTILHPNNDLGFAHHRIRRGQGVTWEGHRPPTEDYQKRLAEERAGQVEGPYAALIREAIGDVTPDKQLAFGLFVNSLIHDVNALCGILGTPQAVEYTDIWLDGQGIHSVWNYGPHLHATLTWVLLPVLKDYREELAFFGSDSRVTLTFPSPYFRNMPTPVIIQGADGELAWEKKVIVNYEEEFKEELRHFYQCVLAGQQPLTALPDARRDLDVIMMMAKAMR